MTVRVRQLDLDPRKIAAILTPALLSPPCDDALPDVKAGVAWLRWGDANQGSSTHLN
jgi:hypothetical protein